MQGNSARPVGILGCGRGSVGSGYADLTNTAMSFPVGVKVWRFVGRLHTSIPLPVVSFIRESPIRV
jgi:hypothetical protein